MVGGWGNHHDLPETLPYYFNFMSIYPLGNFEKRRKLKKKNRVAQGEPIKKQTAYVRKASLGYLPASTRASFTKRLGHKGHNPRTWAPRRSTTGRACNQPCVQLQMCSASSYLVYRMVCFAGRVLGWGP